MELLNTLYITTQGAYVHLDHDTVRVDVKHEPTVQLPLIHLGGVVCFGNVLLSPNFIHRCADDGRFVVWLSRTGRFKARMEGKCGGNVLLRRAQHLALSSPVRPLTIAGEIVVAKIQNGRRSLLRAARESGAKADELPLRAAAARLEESLRGAQRASTLDELRGVEGEAARTYFGAFDAMIRTDRVAFALDGR